MKFWNLLKSVFVKKEKVIEQPKDFLLDYKGNPSTCELCEEFIEKGTQKTILGKKVHCKCYKEARREVKRQYGI